MAEPTEMEWVRRAQNAQAALNAMGAGHLAPDPVSDALDRLTNRNAELMEAIASLLAYYDSDDGASDWVQNLELAIANLREVATR